MGIPATGRAKLRPGRGDGTLHPRWLGVHSSRRQGSCWPGLELPRLQAGSSKAAGVAWHGWAWLRLVL